MQSQQFARKLQILYIVCLEHSRARPVYKVRLFRVHGRVYGLCIRKSTWAVAVCGPCTRVHDRISVREKVFYVLFQISKKTWILTFFEITYQKSWEVFSRNLVFNPSKWVHILRSVITIIQFPATRVWSILSHCWTFWLLAVGVVDFLQTSSLSERNWAKLVHVWLYSQQKTKSSDWGHSTWSCLRPFKLQTVAEAAVARLPGSKHRVGTLRFWQQWRGTMNIKHPYLGVSPK